tara:strand:- start:751 stop:1203 length:453 start_codon:yes stop_codon:yes gene_type:complete
MDKKKSVSNKSKKIKVSSKKPYYSSKALKKGFEQRLPSALATEDMKKHSPFGNMSPRAALLNLSADAINLTRSKEGQRGARFAKKVAKKVKERKDTMNDKKKMMGGGKVKKYKEGGSITQQQEMAMGKTSKSSKSKSKKGKGGCQNRLYM